MSVDTSEGISSKPTPTNKHDRYLDGQEHLLQFGGAGTGGICFYMRATAARAHSHMFRQTYILLTYGACLGVDFI